MNWRRFFRREEADAASTAIATLLPEGSNAWPKNETASLAPINPHKPALGLHDETAIPRCHSHR
jgi:hypothetical protein